MPTPSIEQDSPEVVVVRTVMSPVDRSETKLPAIRVQHPSPELREHAFEKELVNGIKKPKVNGWSEGYFGDQTQVDGTLGKTQADGTVENGVHL
jgi:hypothetical protein